MKLTDVHTHLEQYDEKDLPAVLKRARDTGVRYMVTSGMDMATSRKAVELASLQREVLSSVGFHPWVAAKGVSRDAIEQLTTLVRKDLTVAIGEVGLDFVDNVFLGVTYHDNEILCSHQEEAFRFQVRLACDLSLPIIIHARGANHAVLHILKEERAHQVGGVIHNFEGDPKTAGRFLDLGFIPAFGGAITYPDAEGLHDTIRSLPIEGILIETDSPYMSLWGEEDQPNEPANTFKIAERLAEIRKLEVDELISAVYANFVKLLSLPES